MLLAASIALSLVSATAAVAAEETTSTPASSPPASAPPTTLPSPDGGGHDTAAELSPLLIEGTQSGSSPLVERSFETPEDSTGFGETIFAEPTWRGFQPPAELLGESVGAQLQRQGGRDDFSSLRIRAAPSGQLRILLDGVSLGRASDSVVNLADLPLDMIERIEVYRGFAPVALSPTSAAGVVNVITRDPSKPTASAAAGGGSWGSIKETAGAAGSLLGGSAAAYASYRHTDGDFEYIDDNGTPFNTADDRKRKRGNNDSDVVESLLRWRGDVASLGQLQLRDHLFFRDEGVAGLAAFAPPHARLETIREIGAAQFGSRDRRWSLGQNATWESQRLYDYGNFSNTGETTTATTSGRWSSPVGASHWLQASGDYSWENFDQSNDGGVLQSGDADRSMLAIALGDDWTIAALDTTLIFQLRRQDVWNSFSSLGGGNSSDHSTDPRVGMRWQAPAGFVVKSNVSSYFRPPSFDELFGVNGFTIGNPDLRPETGIAWDAGFEWKGEREPFGRLAFGSAYFGSDIDDVIVIRQTADRTSKAFNEGKARIDGLELSAEWRGPWGFALSSNYTYQHAVNRSTTPRSFHGKDLPDVPPQEFHARLGWTRDRLTLAYDLDLTGKHYQDSENVEPRRPTRTVHGLEVVYGPFWKNLTLTFEATNLGNSLVPDQYGWPLPGRSFFATLSWSLPSDRDREPR